MNKKIGIIAIITALLLGSIIAEIANYHSLIKEQNNLIATQNQLIIKYIDLLETSQETDNNIENKNVFCLLEESNHEAIITPRLYHPQYFKKIGALYWGEYKWTWYSERVLPGTGLDIPGRHADDDGFICDIDNYICVASSVLPNGSIIDTPFGKQGKVYDCGCAANIIDIYVNW